MRKLKTLLMLFFTCIVFISASACWLFKPYKYNGNFPELYTVAVNNLFAAWGYYDNGEVIFSPDINVIETDEYGRTLFYYDEMSRYYDKGFEGKIGYAHYYYAILIMQKASDGFVYYYEDVCIELHLHSDVSFRDINEDIKSKNFSHLKEVNDWGKPLQEDKCVQKNITTRNKSTLDISEKTFEHITREYATFLGDKGNDIIYRFELYNTSDCYGRELYYVEGISRDVYGEGISPTSTHRYFHFAIIFNPDGSYNKDTCITEIQDPFHYQEDLILLKSKNQWNQPYSG